MSESPSLPAVLIAHLAEGAGGVAHLAAELEVAPSTLYRYRAGGQSPQLGDVIAWVATRPDLVVTIGPGAAWSVQVVPASQPG